MSKALASSAAPTSAAVTSPPPSSSSSAAIAAAWGAAAEVPQKVAKPGVAVLTQSAAAKSGFWRSSPPVAEKSPGVSGVPSARKKTRRGPSELKLSTGSLPSNAPPAPPA